MFFKKTTSRLVAKLTRKHGYSVAIVRINALITEDMQYQSPDMLYCLVKSGVVLGLVPLGQDAEISLVKFQADTILSTRDVNSNDIQELRDILDDYGYVLTISDEVERPKLATVTPLKED